MKRKRKFISAALAVIMAAAAVLPSGALPASASGAITYILSNTSQSNASDYDLDYLETQYGDALDTLVEGLLSHDEYVEIYDYMIPVSELTTLIEALRYNRMCWFLSTQYSYNYYVEDGENYVYAFYPVYAFTATEVTANNTLIYEKLNSVIAKASTLSTQVDKLLYLHNYLIDNIEYDTSYTNANNNVYAAMVGGCSMCEGYAESFSYMANQLGIPTYVVASSAIGHAWNLVYLDGYYYHVDCTWDDPVISNLNLISYPVSGYVQNVNFLCSDAAITNSSHSSTDWRVNGVSVYGIAANSTKYDSLAFKDECVLLQPSNGAWYYAEKDTSATRKASVHFNIKKVVFESNSTCVISVERQIYTYCAITGSQYYTTFYATLQSIDGHIYYNTADGIYLLTDGAAENGSSDLQILQNSNYNTGSYLNIYDFDIDLVSYTFTVVYGNKYDDAGTNVTYDNEDYFCAVEGHRYCLESSVAATETEDGSETYSCVACGEAYTQTVYCRQTMAGFCLAALNSHTGDSTYNALVDMNGDGYINMRDYSIIKYEYSPATA